MANHNVTFNVPERELGKSDIVFKIKKNSNALGTLKVSKGSIEWIPKNCSKNRIVMVWDEFNELVKNHSASKKESKKIKKGDNTT